MNFYQKYILHTSHATSHFELEFLQWVFLGRTRSNSHTNWCQLAPRKKKYRFLFFTHHLRLFRPRLRLRLFLADALHHFDQKWRKLHLCSHVASAPVHLGHQVTLGPSSGHLLFKNIRQTKNLCRHYPIYFLHSGLLRQFQNQQLDRKWQHFRNIPTGSQHFFAIFAMRNQCRRLVRKISQSFLLWNIVLRCRSWIRNRRNLLLRHLFASEQRRLLH